MRVPNWTARLAEVFAMAEGKPFAWGENDCCLFAADCCLAIAGKDPAAEFRGTYKTEAGAKRAIKKISKTLEGAFDIHFEQISWAFVQRGDVVLYDGPKGRGIGIFWAGNVWSITETKGLARIEFEPVTVWRVE